MAFGFSGLSGYENNMNTATRAGSTSSQTSSLSGTGKTGNNSLTGLSAGQIVTGEVTAINGKQVQITMQDKQVINARLEADMKLSVGQSMAFEVKSNSGSQVALTPLFENTAVNPAAIKALGEAFILVNESSLSMASTMMEEGMPIDRNSLQQMFRLVNQFQDANPADIVSMKAQGIAIDAQSIEQYGLYKDNHHQIISLAQDLSEGISGMMEDMTMEEKEWTAAIFGGELTEDNFSEMKSGLMQESDAVNTLMKEAEAAAQAKALAEANKTPPSILDLAASLNETKAEEAAKAETPETERAVTEQPEVVIAAEETAGEADTELNNLLSLPQRQEIADVLKDFGLSSESLSQIIDGTMEPEKVLNNIRAALSLSQDGTLDQLNLENKEGRKTAIAELTTKDSFRALVKNSIVSSWSLAPDGATSKEKINQLYERIMRDTGKTLQLMEHMGKEDSSLAKGVENLRQNVQFMNQLNETFQYVQLPVKMAGGDAHGDLYVYSKKKNLSLQDGEVSALLHLEMETLGTMDIHVAMKDESHVNTHFYLQNDEMLDFIEDNISILDERLQKRGYNSAITASVKNDKNAPENPVMDKMFKKSGPALKTHYSFDVKA